MITGAIIVAVLLGAGLYLLSRVGGDFWLFLRAGGRVCLTADGLKLLAFLGASGAGVAMTAYLVWNTYYLHGEKRSDDVAYLAYGAMILLGLTQLSLHRLLGAKQAIEIEFWKLKAKLNQGGDDESA